MANFAINTDRNLERAKLIEISWKEDNTVQLHLLNSTVVQFNPASLKVSYSNRVQTKDQNTPSSRQFRGRNASRLSLELIFDASGAETTGIQDVRQMSGRIAAFLKPLEQPPGQMSLGNTLAQSNQGEKTPDSVPGVRFLWGTFVFDGVLESMDETLDFWSEDGRPLRSTVAISVEGIHYHPSYNPVATTTQGAMPGALAAGTMQPFPTPRGKSLQAMVTGAGLKADWKAIAAQNSIEDPRHIAAGTLLNLQGAARVAANKGAEAGAILENSFKPFEEAKRLAQLNARAT
jgi:hypothetical protein